MKTNLHKLGSSRGVQVAARSLSACEFTDRIEANLDAPRHILDPVRNARKGWFDGFDPMDDKAAWPDDHNVGTVTDWKW